MKKQVFDAKTTTIFRCANIFPSGKTLGPSASFVSRPGEGPANSVEFFQNLFWETKNRHEVYQKGVQD